MIKLFHLKYEAKPKIENNYNVSTYIDLNSIESITDYINTDYNFTCSNIIFKTGMELQVYLPKADLLTILEETED